MESRFTAIRYEAVDAVATITLARPDALNALDAAMKTDLLAAIHEAGHDRTVRVVILTGAGRAFCAGQDLREETVGFGRELRERFNPIILGLRELDKPVIAAVNGVAAGAGASIAFACDIRLAAEGASFLLAFGRVGLVPDSGATWFLPRLVGPSLAAELIMTTDPLPAADALRVGLVSRVVPDERLMDEANGLARRLAAGAPRALAPSAPSHDPSRSGSRRRSTTKPSSRTSPAERPTTPRACPPSSRSGHRASPASSFHTSSAAGDGRRHSEVIHFLGNPRFVRFPDWSAVPSEACPGLG